MHAHELSMERKTAIAHHLREELGLPIKGIVQQLISNSQQISSGDKELVNDIMISATGMALTIMMDILCSNQKQLIEGEKRTEHFLSYLTDCIGQGMINSIKGDCDCRFCRQERI